MTYSGRLGDRYAALGSQSLATKNTFQVFCFSCISTKNTFEVASSDFTMHLIIRNGLEDRNADKRKAIRQEELEAKEETVYESDFIYLNTY